MNLSPVDAIVLLAYLAGIVGFGCWFARKSTGTEEFMAAGRSLPGWVVGLSIFGTFVSSISFLANPGKSYGGNWNPFVFGLSLPVAAWIATRWFVPLYRRTGSISAYERLEARFGPWARIYAVACFILTQLARIGAILYLVAIALVPFIGWNPDTIIIATGILVVIYTLLGGIEAVIWTDVVQSVVLTVGILATLAVIGLRLPDGWATAAEIATDQGKFSLGDFGASLSKPTFWVVLVYGLFINLQNFGIDQSYVQRYVTARSESAARRSVWLGALLYLPISALLFLVGTGLFAFYQTFPDRLPAGTAADGVFPHFIAAELPAGLTGLLIAAVLAAAMSSVDSSLNSSATLVLCDIYRRYVNRTATERQSMRVLRATTAICGGIGILAGILFHRAGGHALDNWWAMASVLSGGMLGLFLLGVIARHATSPGAAAGVAAGTLVILWIGGARLLEWALPPELFSTLKSPFHSLMAIVVGTITVIAVGALVSRRDRRAD